MRSDLARIHDKFQTDLRFFAKHAPLMIRTKEAELKPLEFNKAQLYVHDRLERQLKETGKVRAFILKGRQQGISTYIAARFYHKATRNKGLSTFILSHEADTTAKLFKIVKRYHNSISPQLKPTTSASNRKELIFSKLDSEYFVGTAGNKEVGRGGTPQLFHGSEVAFWPNQDEIKKGLIQSVPDVNGSEIIHESTANGMDAMFYRGIKESLKGNSEYQVIFVPWFWQDEYTKPIPKDFSLTDEEVEYKEIHKVSNEHLMWRRSKISELNGVEHFRQEYPATIDEAFQTSGEGLINPNWILKARKNYRDKVVEKHGPLIMGVDPARDGDRTVISFRRGRKFPKIYKYESMTQMRLAGIIADFLSKHEVAKCFIDVAHGYGCIDRLEEMGYGHIVQGVHFGETPIQDDLYMNKRAEMWLELKEWISREGVAIPDDEEVHADLSIMPDYILTSSGKKRLVSKDEIKKKLGLSPDIGDAMALTFAYPVNEDQNKVQLKNVSKGLCARSKRGK